MTTRVKTNREDGAGGKREMKRRGSHLLPLFITHTIPIPPISFLHRAVSSSSPCRVPLFLVFCAPARRSHCAPLPA
jgi:hypothetical protein